MSGLSFEKMASEHPGDFRQAVSAIDHRRLADLLDHGDHGAIGHYIWCLFDARKAEIEVSLLPLARVEPQDIERIRKAGY